MNRFNLEYTRYWILDLDLDLILDLDLDLRLVLTSDWS